jgi:hypothetical protein
MPDVEPFEEFLARTRAARPEQYSIAASEFEKMKEYILDSYRGVHPVSSFVNEAGQVIDCIPFEQQPSVRAAIEAGQKVIRTPPPPSRLGRAEGQPPAPTGQRGHPTQQSQNHGGTCPPGAVPMPRLTLERLVRFGELKNFFKKGPVEVEAHPSQEGAD